MHYKDRLWHFSWVRRVVNLNRGEGQGEEGQGRGQ